MVPRTSHALKTFTIWTLIKTQLTTHVSQHSQIKHIQDALEEPINIQWRSPSEIFHNISKARKQLKLIRRNDKEARKHHLLNRASAANLENRKQDEKTILNLQRIEQTIMMWRTINYLTRTEDESSSQTIDIPEDSSIKWNDIKYHKGLIFKTISDPEQIDKYYAERNTHHLNQAQGSAFTIEPLNRLIGEDSFTSFSDEILNGTADLSKLKFSPIIKKYLHQLKRNKTIITSNKNKTISLNEFKKGYKIWKEGTTTSPSGRHLGHHHALLAPDGVQYDDSNTNFADTM